jgi:peptidoglycan/xylan/chitin deacetylase (PgdA/CDA1 family)
VNAARQLVKRAAMMCLSPRRFLVDGSACVRTADGPRGSKQVQMALTFDDGPHPQWTPAVLDALSQAGWRGTFFLIGERAAQHPELVRRIVAEGHDVGNHTWTHAEPRQTSTIAFREEVERTELLLEQLAGSRTGLVRPPKGELTLGKFCTLWRSGCRIALWNIDPRDYSMSSSDQAEGWAAAYRPRHGDILLLHDRLPLAAEIVKGLAARHGPSLGSVGLSAWIGRAPDSPRAGGSTHTASGHESTDDRHSETVPVTDGSAATGP